MRSKLALAFVVILFTTLSACNRKTVSLEFTNAEKEVSQLQNLVFRFSKPLVSDSLLNRWDATEYISFEPKIPGKFRWESPDELVFSPANPLAPATNYTATINKAVLQHSAYGQIEQPKKISFYTPALKLEGSNITWVLQDENSTSAIPQVELSFNYPIQPAQLKEKLRLQVDGKSVNYSLVSASASRFMVLRILDLRAEDRDMPISISLDKGLLPEGGSNPTAEAQQMDGNVPSPFVLTINDMETEHDGSTGKLIIRTSQQLANNDLSALVKISPAVKFSTELTENGLFISSDGFSNEKTYELTILKGLRGKIGGQLKEDYTNSFGFGELEPSVNFTNRKATYLSGEGYKNIEVSIVNIPKVKVVVSKIYENNLLAAKNYGYSPEEKDGEQGYYYNEGGDLSFGDVIYEKEIETSTLPKNGASRLFHFSVEDKLPDFKGIYHIRIRSSDDYWVSDSRFISLSDIGLIAKEGKDAIWVFANSIKTAKAMKDVTVSAYGANNQLLGMGTTDENGVATIAYMRKEMAGFKPAMLVAKTAGDFNYLPFSNTAVNTSRFEVGGKRINSTGIDAFVYAERDIYRPGEKINFALIARNANWQSPGEMPLKMKFLLPTGKELKTIRKNLNAQGMLEGSLDIATAAITGSYTMEVYTGNDVLLTTKNFMVEEFVPDRIKVNTKLDKAQLKPGEKANLSITATNFFGPPAANRKYETEIQVNQLAFSPKKYRQFQFNLANQNSFFDKQLREGNTNEQGNASESFTVPDMYKNIGLLQTNFYTTVFDETGRPVSRKASAEIYTQEVFFGIGDNGYDYFPLQQPIRFPVIALDKNERPLNGAVAAVQVIKHEYRTVLAKSGNYFRYESQQEDKVVAQGNATINGENTFYSFTPRTPGNYEIRLYIPGASAYVSRSFYSYGSWGGDNNSFDVNTEGEIDIETDKASYAEGESVKLLFKTPFNGKMLVTMEQDKVLSHQYVDVSKRNASLDLQLTAEHLPNVYITATLFKPHDASDIPLTVAHGFRSVKVEQASRKMRVDIQAQSAVRSRTHQKVMVKTQPGSQVTLAAVDNGVLQVTDFATPDPYAHFYAQRALGVNAFDLYPLLFPELKARLSSTGGDGALSMNQRVNPMPNKRVKIVSYWSGIKTANSSGEASFEFDIPQFSGEVRLMALAVNNNQFGSGEKLMTVADPVVLSTAMPRFLSPTDTINVPVTITNTTRNNGNLTASIRVQGPLEVIGSGQQTASVEAGSEAVVNFRVAARSQIAAGKVEIEVAGMGEKFREETDITVRPPSTLQKMTGSGVVNANSTKAISIGTADFMPGSSRYQLVVSRSPALELANQLQYLVEYPYGCTEQTVSSAFPQLYFGDMADLLKKGTANKQSANANVMEAIRKIKMRQLYNGAITLWDQADTENWWATTYSAHFLLEARKAGFEVEQGLLNTMLGYINNRLRNKETINYIYNRDKQKKIAPKEVAYSLYVLALAGRPNVPVMNYYKSRPDILSLDSKYLLAATYALAGDKSRFKELLPGSFSGEVAVAQTGGSFYSDIRDEAIALNALIEIDPNNAQVPVMARHVTDQLKQRRWYSTQESSFGFLAIGKLSRKANQANTSGEIRANGKTIARINNNTVKLSDKELPGTNVDLVVKGNGQLYYWWQSEGISISGAYKEEDSYLKIRRKFYNRNGQPIHSNVFNQNDLVIVQLVLEKSYSSVVENVVITDLLPAGFEIENPRTKEIPGMDWIKDASTPTHIDVRDDRIHLFVDAQQNRQVYYYAVRAVSPGKFRMGPASADAMYNSEYHSYHGAGMITVKKP
ncbi:MG2 domain-containing protein [Flavihumibacter rivuli]|uniref:alpha-2-macroglobulin family protein n=1 Tax=Flavihumibacter rivuli TaxID=2838156 RepID=UPI001BDF0FC6|nr:MG2 domain-containing protein [Flavihumibacter rivuli]ULQ55926.1 MG2 domain-containing protein [Flavihumibacter rivuli]